MRRALNRLIVCVLPIALAAPVFGADAMRSEKYTVDGSGATAEELAALIRERLFVEEFKDSNASLKIEPGALTIVQTPEVQAQLRDLFVLLRKTVPPASMIVNDADAWRADFDALVAKKRVSVSFEQTPLNEVAAQLSKSTGIAIRVDDGIAADRMPKVDLKLDDVTLDSALKWITRASGVRCYAHDHALLLTSSFTPDVELRIYEVGDITEPAGMDVRLIEKKDFAQWPYLYDTFCAKTGHRLVVRGSAAGQKQIVGILVGLRSYIKQIREVEPDGKPPQKPLAPARVPGHSAPHIEAPWEQAIRAKLERSVSFDFKEKPLKDVIEYFRTECRINIVVAPNVWEHVADSAITLRVNEMTAVGALYFVLKLADVEYQLSDEAVIVHMRENIDSRMVCDFYVRDLTSVIAPPDLKAQVLEIFPYKFHPALGTSIDEAHGIITLVLVTGDDSRMEALFDQLRLHADDAAFTPSRMVVEMYDPLIEYTLFNLSDLCGERAAALTAEFSAQFPDGTDDNGAHFIRLVGKRLIVLHTKDVREKIGKALEEIREAKR